MKRSIRQSFVAPALIALSAASFYAGRQSAPQMSVKLDNARVTVSESVTPKAGRREPYVRPTDQLIIFLDDASYQSIDAAGKVTERRRRAGEVIWHDKGERAPLLVTRGDAYRNLVVAFK